MEKRLILTSIYIVTIILFTIIISAVPAPQDIFEFKQPDNNTFFGIESGMAVTNMGVEFDCYFNYS
jgi:hypothetical protein